MTLRPSEKEVTAGLVRDLESLIMGDFLALREVRSHGRARTDVVVQAGPEIWGIEVKVADWRGAIAQAVLNRYCFDRSFVALASSPLPLALQQEVATWGLGLIGIVNNSWNIVRFAARQQPDEYLKNSVLRKFEAVAK